MSYVLPILATLVGLIATWLMLVLLLAGSPNSKPEQWSQIKAWMITVGIAGAVGLIGAIWLMVLKKPMPAAAFGASPALVCTIAFVIMLRTQS